MKDTTSVGNITEGAVLGALLRRGYTVLVPFGSQQGYDYVLHHKGEFSRVQCKTGRIIQGSVRFRLYSVTRGAGAQKYRRSHYGTAVDFYGVYCPDNQGCYLIPSRVLSSWVGCLRLELPKNNQRKNVTWAKDYIL